MSKAIEKLHQMLLNAKGIGSAPIDGQLAIVGLVVPADQVQVATEAFPILVFLAGMGASVNIEKKILK